MGRGVRWLTELLCIGMAPCDMAETPQPVGEVSASDANRPEDAVRITETAARVIVHTYDGAIEIARIQDTEHRLEGDWGKTSRPAPPAVLQPLVPAEGVVPLGELELIDMLMRANAVVVDSRKAEQHAQSTLPGAINIPFTEVEDRLDLLGCVRRRDGWDCRGARQVALFCNGVWCGQSPAAIRRMIAAGYPADLIHYYRNGMQGWLLQGLSTCVPERSADNCEVR